MKICERLKSLRVEHNLTQKALAQQIGMTANTYQRYEYGERELTTSKLIIIANLFGVSIDYLVGRTDNPAINK